MTAQLEPQPTDRVLEIGTGSGYQAALLSPLVDQVYTIEILEELGRQAADRLQTLGYHNVHVRIGDGFLGWPEQAPFDKIIVTCSPEDIPEPLIAQLKDGGKLLIPLGDRYQQALCLITKRGDKLKRQTLESTFFVPMTGRAEVLRQNQQDDGSPLLVNGGFESQTNEGTPAGWYYLRQAVLGTEPPIHAGASYLRLSNETPGRPAQALQAIGLDGRRYREVEINVAVRHHDVVLEEPNGFAGIELRFFDENRAPLGTARLGSWQGTGGWSEHASRFRVPAQCRLVVVGLGLFGATGDLALDSLSLQAHEQIAKGPFD